MTSVFDPLKVGPITIPNRIVRTAHGTHFTHPPAPYLVDSTIAYHRERAMGGVGLSILGGVGLHPSAGNPYVLSDEDVPCYQKLADEVRPYGMKVFQQLYHMGHERLTRSGDAPWAPSEFPSYFGIVGVPMTRAQIDELVTAYADAAQRCRDGGLDGVEVNLLGIPNQFLSPIVNTRTDDFGGTFENRLRFTKLVLEAIKERVGGDIAIGVRAAESQMQLLLPLEEVQESLRIFEAEGLIDFLTTSIGFAQADASVRGMEYPAGYQVPSASKLTSVVSTPSIITGRFRTLAEADELLASGAADMVSMVRALIADPHIVRKTREGREGEIRPCIACNQGCLGSVNASGSMGCTVNPLIGLEATHSESLLSLGSRPGKVLVVGGGPAGLEAARVLALGGKEVVLVEARPTLGGAIRTAALGPRNELIADIVDWLSTEMDRLGVTVELNTLVTEENVGTYNADTIIVATGSEPAMDGIQHRTPEAAPSVDQPHVMSSWDLLTGGVAEGVRTALVLDTVGHFEGVSVTEYLVSRGLSVTYVTHNWSFAGPAVQSTRRVEAALGRMQMMDGDVTVHARHFLADIKSTTSVIGSVDSESLFEVPADVVVLVTPNRPLRGLFEALSSQGEVATFVVGDAAVPRDLQAAIRDGYMTAREVLAAGSLQNA